MYCVVYPKRKKINKIVEYKLQAGTGFPDCCPKFSSFFFWGGGGWGGGGLSQVTATISGSATGSTAIRLTLVQL